MNGFMNHPQKSMTTKNIPVSSKIKKKERGEGREEGRKMKGKIGREQWRQTERSRMLRYRLGSIKTIEIEFYS